MEDPQMLITHTSYDLTPHHKDQINSSSKQNVTSGAKSASVVGGPVFVGGLCGVDLPNATWATSISSSRMWTSEPMM